MAFAVITNAQQENKECLKWKIVAELPGEKFTEKSLGVAGPVAGIHNQKMLIAGGANFPDGMPWEGGKKKYHATSYIFQKKEDDLVLVDRQELPVPLAYAATCSTPAGVFVAGGENENGISDLVWLIQLDKATNKQNIINYPRLPLPLANASISFVEGKIYVAGGETKEGNSDKIYSLDLEKKDSEWELLADIPASISHFVMVNIKRGKKDFLVLIGGRKKNKNGISDFYDTVMEYDITNKKWSQLSNLPYALSAGTGAVINKKYIVIFGGDKGKTFHETELLIAAINAESEIATKNKLTEQKNKLQSTHPGFSTEILLYDIINDKWQAIGNLPYKTPVTTIAIPWQKEIYIPSGEIKAGVRTPDILSVRYKK